MHSLLTTSIYTSWQLITKLGFVRGGRIALRSAWSIVKVVLAYPRSLLSFRRNVSCKNCDMYSAKWGSCGEPGETYKDGKGEVHRSGCWCIVRYANRDPKKACWLRFHGFSKGWDERDMPLWWRTERQNAEVFGGDATTRNRKIK
jgi:hypothetical protein